MEKTADTKNKNILVKITVPVILLFIVSFFFLFHLLYGIFIHNTDPEGEDRNYHVFVVGQSDTSSFLNQVFEGAGSVSEDYSALVELKVPNSLAENISVQSLIDYVSYVNADGVIAYVNPQTEPLRPVYRTDGTEIPIITIGHYFSENPQISFIGSNYSNLGRKIGAESEELFDYDGSAFVVVSGISNSPNHSNLLNSLLDYYRGKGISNFEVFDKSIKENESSVSSVISDKKFNHIALICLTEEDSMMVLQLVTTMPVQDNIKILGFGESETINMYLEKGILSKLISYDRIGIGKTAMRELFEYRSKGYANSYIAADLLVRTAGK